MITLQDVLLLGKIDLFVVATGAGTSLLTKLWATPGASAYLRNFHFPYDTDETNQFLGFTPSHYCDETTAVLLALEAYVRARRHYFRRGDHLKPETVDKIAIGLSLTASVASKTAHRGEHRAYSATVSGKGGPVCAVSKVVLEKGVGTFQRVGDDVIVSDKAHDMLSSAVLGLDPQTAYSEEDIKKMLLHPPHPLTGNVEDKLDTVYIPGNYNPLHDSHKRMGEVMRTRYSLHPVYTTCVNPPHKPALSLLDMLDRIAMFRALAPESSFAFTCDDPLYVDKMKKRPMSNWVVGGDTLDRLLDPKWGPTTDDVCDVIEKTASKIYTFPAKDGDSWIDLPRVVTKYKSEKLKRLVNSLLVHVSEALPGIRSTHLRAAAGR